MRGYETRCACDERGMALLMSPSDSRAAMRGRSACARPARRRVALCGDGADPIDR